MSCFLFPSNAQQSRIRRRPTRGLRTLRRNLDPTLLMPCDVRSPPSCLARHQGLPADRFGHTDCSGTKNYGNDAAFRIDNEDYARSSIAETAATAKPTAVREPRKEHVVALLVDDGDQDFQEFMQSCQDACDSVVHKCCFQWPQTRHITLWDLTLTLTLIPTSKKPKP